MNYNNRPKRGAKFYHTDLKCDLWLYRIISHDTYLMCDTPTFDAATGIFEPYPVSVLKSAKNAFKSNIKNSAPSEEKKQEKKERSDFYTNMALKMPFLCDNCNKPLNAFNKFAKRAVTAHILPKHEFPELATDKDNIFFLGWQMLGVCSCHDDYDRKGAENRTKMKVYDLAVSRFNNSLKDKLSGKQLIKAYTYLNIKWQ